MDAIFDNKENIINANIVASRDKSPIYNLSTQYSLWGRRITYLKDANPSLGDPDVVGAINWKDKTLEVEGQRKKVSEVKRKLGGLVKKVRHWKWLPSGPQYEVSYVDEEWKAVSTKDRSVIARLNVSDRPHLFSKNDPPALHIIQPILSCDEVFLILVLIYSEVKRKDAMNGSGGW